MWLLSPPLPRWSPKPSRPRCSLPRSFPWLWQATLSALHDLDSDPGAHCASRHQPHATGKMYMALLHPVLFAQDASAAAQVKLNFPRDGSKSTPPHPSGDFKWKDYCPVAFRQLREVFSIDAAQYMTSICGPPSSSNFPAMLHPSSCCCMVHVPGQWTSDGRTA